MILSILAFINTVHEGMLQMWSSFKQTLRRWLGPAPRKIYLLENNDITEFQTDDVPVYCPSRCMIRMNNQQLHGRGTRLPWVHMEYINDDDDIPRVNFTDWISQVRYYHVDPPSLLQLFRLASTAHHMYLPERDARLFVMTRTGEEEVYAFRGATFLSLITSIQEEDS